MVAIWRLQRSFICTLLWCSLVALIVLCVVYQGSASVVSGTPSMLLSSMSTDVVCERVRLIDGIDQNLLSQYTATIKKVCIREEKSVHWEENSTLGFVLHSDFVISQANINGRVLSQCNIDELKKEMNMNFGDWQLFRTTVSNFLSFI